MTRHLHEHFEQPEHCPYCGSDQIDGRHVDIEHPWARQQAHCLACGRTWHDRYHLQALVDDQGQTHQRPLGPAAPVASTADRDLRQRDIVPPKRLAGCNCTVVGVGAIGRQVALQLTAIGVARLQLIDPQIVESVNLAGQGYLEQDLGMPKAEATARLCTRLNARVTIDPVISRFRKSMDIGNTLLCCVDAIDTRQLIWHAVNQRVDLFVDGRMSAEVIRILTANDQASREHYPTTLFAREHAHAEPCTARTTIYTANIAAGLMLHQFTRHLRHLPLDPDLQYNLLASELVCA